MAVVCHCHVVGDRAIRAAVERGATDAEQVAVRTGAGSSCGGCLEAVAALVDEVRSRLAGVAPGPSAA